MSRQSSLASAKRQVAIEEDEKTKSEQSNKLKKLKTQESIETLLNTSLVIDSAELIENNRKLYRLDERFFDELCLDLCKKLLGKYLIRCVNDRKKNKSNLMIGKIVEVEAYLGGDDKASHSYNNKQTDRTKAMYMKAGTAYVYNIYGMYCCLNISSREAGGAVLVRALEPIVGIDAMSQYRYNNQEQTDKKKMLKNLTSGPSKLCLAMNITKSLFDQADLANSVEMWLQEKISLGEDNSFDPSQCSSYFASSSRLYHDCNKTEIVNAKRINIDYAGEEAINKLYRFYIKSNPFVSIKCKEKLTL
jgi:DNA-3-methyladenine glycosylase